MTSAPRLKIRVCRAAPSPDARATVMALARERHGDSSDEDASPSAKRAKASDARYDARGYVPGALMRVTMHNFMTHKHATFEPGPRLNVVLGPNGTGKSAFVCAVCVGLGGSPKLLGRAGSLGDFVKRGEESAYTEITLRGRDAAKPIIIRRDFNNRAGGASTWKLNGETVKHERIQQEMKALHMQLDNLCSFLPQDRVVAFSMLNPQELLLETEKAIGNAEMYEQHEKLKKMKGGILDLERSVDQKTMRLDKLGRDNEKLERDVERLQTREKLLDQAKDMSTKIPWLLYDRCAVERQQIMAAYKAAKEKVQQAKLEHAEKLKEYHELETPYNAMVDKIKEGRDNYKDTKSTLSKMDAKFHKLAGKHDALTRSLKKARDEANSAKKKLQKREDTIALLKAQLNDVPEVPRDIDQQRAELRTRTQAVHNEVRGTDEALRKAQLEKRPLDDEFQRLKRQHNALESVREQKIMRLSQHRNFGRIKEADDWVQKNKPTFHGEVLGPLIAEIEVTNPTHATYIEQHLGPAVLATYLVTDRRDERSVNDAMKNFRINVWTPKNNTQHVPGVVSQELRDAGVVNTLDNVFKAKSIVKRALSETHQITKVHVGGNTLDSATIERLFRQKISSHIYCPKGVYRANRSRYDPNAFSMGQNSIRQGQLFGRQTDENLTEVKNKLAEVQRKLVAMNEKVSELQKLHNAKQGQLTELQREKNNLNRLQQQPETRKRMIQTQIAQHTDLMAQDKAAADIANIERKTAAEKASISKERVMCASELCDVVLSSHEASISLTLKVLQSVEKQVQMTKLQEALQGIEDRVINTKAKRDDLKARFQAETERAAALKRDALAVTGDLTEEINEKFGQWPITIEELEFDISRLQEQADAILCHNPAVLDEFNKRKAEMATLTKTLASEKAELAVEHAAITSVKNEWLPKLRKIVAKISDDFSRNFANIGCAGQISLAGDGSREHDGFGDDFASYALEIRVKFRPNEDMHLLDAHRQSGGERSVTTMLYMIALQASTSAPFRVVDEINQGMDARNERKVFKRMVEAASAPGTPQCFVITPKLLTQLEYSEDCTVMCIFNGPHVHEMAKKWREMQAAFDCVRAR
jgi:chromosome segregation ATPase